MKGRGYSCPNTWAGFGHLLAGKPSSEKEKLCTRCSCCFQAHFGFQEAENCLHHRSDSVVPKLKRENPIPFLDTNSAFTEANFRCQHASLISGRRKRITPFYLEVIRSTRPYLSKLIFGEFISFLMTRLHQSDHVPV